MSESIIGTGSWYWNQSYNDYRHIMEFNEWRRYLYEECVKRIEQLNLQEGDLISLVSIGGNKPKKFKGVVISSYSSRIYITQKSRTISFDVTLVDEVEVLSKRIDLVFEMISPEIYIMAANRLGDVADRVYSQQEIESLAKTCKIEIKK